jgi:pseudouridylate synthase / pseudouridine kinase
VWRTSDASLDAPAAAYAKMSPQRPAFAARLRVHPEISAAVAAGLPVVALESSIICHGMDWPANLTTALACEAAVRAAGAVPATVAVLDGTPLVGCSAADLRHIAGLARDRASSGVRKVARRDLAKVVCDRACGGTTVSATMALAKMAGVRVFATGGVGGVHRGVAESWDVSADVAALADTPVLLVCAGVKTILDVPKTLEALESASVPVVTLRPDAGEFPAFYTRRSGVPTPDTVDSEEEAAGVAAAQLELGRAGMLMAVPIPHRHEADSGLIASALEVAMAEKDQQGVSGRETTPFLLARIADLTRDHSLRANMELVKNNAAVAARIAGHMCAMQRSGNEEVGGGGLSVVVAGGCAVDITAAVRGELRRGTSNPGSVSLSVGGVGRNVAEAVRSVGARVCLWSAVGDDGLGQFVLSQLRCSGLADGIAVLPGAVTATYCAVNKSDGDLDTAISDMEIFAEQLPALRGDDLAASFRGAKMLCIDANLNAKDIGALARLARLHGLRVWFEPVSVSKSVRLFAVDGAFASVHYLSPNVDELTSMWSHCYAKQGTQRGSQSIGAMAEDLLNLHQQQGGQSMWIVVTRGAEGLSLFQLAGGDLINTHVPAAPVPGGVVASTSGAGDTLAGSMIACLAEGLSIYEAATLGVEKAAARCAQKETVPMRAKL